MRLSVEEVPATPAMASMLMVIHLMQRSVLRRPDTETCAVRSAHASREVLDRSLSCGRCSIRRASTRDRRSSATQMPASSHWSIGRTSGVK